jgi:DNA (cytosine-5)-methyltransferase 1
MNYRQNKYSIEKESMSFKCEKCDKEFSEKMYARHLLRITPCISEKKLKEKNFTPIKSEETIQTCVMSVGDKSAKLNAIDLFCGCGGMTEGLEKAGINIIAGIDFWDKAIENYRKNHNHLAICQDLTKFPPEKFNELYNKNNVSIDLIVGGPSCQSFSIAGKRDSNDPRDSLFMEYVKYLNFFNPSVFIMENVMGMLSKKTETGKNVIDIIMEQLNRNYNTIICKLYASDFGVPQNRRRVIIIGIRKDLNIIPTEPKPTTSGSKRPPVKTILLPRDQIELSYFLSEKALNGIANKKANSKAKGAGFGAQYLDPEKPSYTIPARYWKDGYDALVKYSETEVRRLTILELKRIQSFPDEYILDGSKKDVIMQIGNAVACKFAFHIGKHIINLLEQSKK